MGYDMITARSTSYGRLHLALLAAATAFLVLPATAPAQGMGSASGDTAVEESYPNVRVGLDAVTVWQALTHENEAGTLGDLSTGFQAALGNFHLYAGLAEGIDVYAELYLSSKHHAGYVMDREGWVRISRLPDGWDLLGLNPVFEHLDIKAGHFEVDFGNQHLYRSDNAQVQRNPLIGNPVVDPNVVEAGLEVTGYLGDAYLLAGLGSGVTVEDFQDGRGYSKHLKLGLVPDDSAYHVAASLYAADHSGNPTGYPNDGSAASLFSGNRSGSRYSGVIRTGSADAGQLNVGRGQDVLAWQFDAAYRGYPVELDGFVGWMEDVDLNGSEEGEPREAWTYYGLATRVDLMFDMLYLAGRYSGATTSEFRGQVVDARVDRFQFGLGYRLVEQMLFKVEYVTQAYDGFPAVYQDDPSFDGFLIEGSVSF